MSKMVTMKTDKPHRHGKSVIISGEKVKFDKLGFTDVMERHVEELLKGGLEIVDEADLKKFAKQRELLEEAEKGNFVPDIDLHDENAKLKVENDNLKKENEFLKSKIGELEALKPVETDGEDKEPVDKKKENDSVNAMSFKELKELCADPELKFPEKEWKGIKKLDELKAYVKSKL